MTFLKRYLIPRLIQYLLVTFLGLTAVFILPRLLPIDPIQQRIAQYQTFGMIIPPDQLEYMISTLRSLFGLEGTLWQQYVMFWQRLLTWDFGPSLARFPTPVSTLIAWHLPWTLALLISSLVIGWVVGTLVGGVAGYYHRSKATRLLDGAAMVVRPIPYYILALLLLILFTHVLPLLPRGGGIGIGVTPEFNLAAIWSILLHATLPALTLIIGGITEHFQAMKLIVQTSRSEDHVWYARSAGVKDGTIVFHYVIRNAMLPRITHLGLSLGFVFSGALITEIVFRYPGVGLLLFNAIMHGDYNLIMGISAISIMVITTSILLLDLLLPLVDPRVRHQ